MFSGRTLVLVGVLAGGYWLWSSGQWVNLAAKVPGLAAYLGQPAAVGGEAAADAPATADATDPYANPAPSGTAPAAPGSIRTWVDDKGVRHYAAASAAPQDSEAHQGKQLGSMTDFEQAVEQETGLRPQDLARARLARQHAAATAEADAAGTADHPAAATARPATDTAGTPAPAGAPQRIPNANLAIQQIEEAKQQSAAAQASMQQAVSRTQTLVRPQ